MKPVEYLRNKMVLFLGKPYVSGLERKFLEKHLESNNVMVEFGAGFSTVHFSKKVKKYYAVEHNEAWQRKIKSKVGSNTEVVLARNKKEYVNFADKIKHRIDIVFIDGEWRAECAKATLKKIDKNSLVFIHDYDHPDGRDYSEVLKWYRIKDRCGLMVMLKKK